MSCMIMYSISPRHCCYCYSYSSLEDRLQIMSSSPTYKAACKDEHHLVTVELIPYVFCINYTQQCLIQTPMLDTSTPRPPSNCLYNGIAVFHLVRKLNSKHPIRYMPSTRHAILHSSPQPETRSSTVRTTPGSKPILASPAYYADKMNNKIDGIIHCFSKINRYLLNPAYKVSCSIHRQCLTARSLPKNVARGTQLCTIQ